MIKKLIAGGESKTVEFKVDFPQKNQIAKTVCAFANRAGGYLIIGVNNDGIVMGIDNHLLDDYLDRISNIVHDQIHPMLIPEIYTYQIENKKVIIVQVYPGNAPPYYLKSEGKADGTYIRVGKTNKIADNELLQELERLKRNKSYDEDVCRELDDASQGDLIRILKKVFDRTITGEKLENLNLITTVGDIDYLTNAAEIILGRMENCCIKCARFTGDSVIDFIDKKEYTGDIFSQLDSAIGFVKSHINMAGIISGSGLKRKDVLEIAEEVFREAIINAIIHRDYSISGADIKIAIYNSHIDIISPGGLPKTITVEEIYAGRSEIRNKVLTRVFREGGIIEQWGSGIPRMREACIRDGLKAPELFEDGLFVKLTIYRSVAGGMVKEKRPVYYADTSKTSEIIREKEQIYRLVCKNESYTVKEISRIMGMSEASAQRRLEALQNERRIIRTGSKKKGSWVKGD